jgi:hypothetical protein
MRSKKLTKEKKNEIWTDCLFCPWFAQRLSLTLSLSLSLLATESQCIGASGTFGLLAWLLGHQPHVVGKKERKKERKKEEER